MTDTIAPTVPDPAADHLPRRGRRGREVLVVVAVLAVAAAITAGVLVMRHERALHVAPLDAFGFQYLQPNGPVRSSSAAGYTQETADVTPGRRQSWVVSLANGSTPITILGLAPDSMTPAYQVVGAAALERRGGGNVHGPGGFRPFPIYLPANRAVDIRYSFEIECLLRRAQVIWTSLDLRVEVHGVVRAEHISFGYEAFAVNGGPSAPSNC